MCAGILVGVINTFAGGGAALTIAVFTALGMPVNIANGTNRIPVLFQCLTMSATFHKQGYLDYKTGLKLSIPTVVGAIVGAQFASVVSNSLLTILLAIILIILLIVLLFNPEKAMRTSALAPRQPRATDFFLFLLIGLYGGCFHIGVGYFILAVVIMGMGYNLLEANALKGFIVLMYIPFSLTIFFIHGQVEVMYGVVHGIGNIIGSYVAARYARFFGMKFLRLFLITFIVITILDLFAIINIQKFLLNILQ